MSTKVYVDHIPAAIGENDLWDLFSPYGQVVAVSMPTDSVSGRARGFGYVTMSTPEEARSATQALHGKVLSSGTLAVSEVWPHEQRNGWPRRR